MGVCAKPMTIKTPIEPYLDLLQKQLATSLMPKNDDNAQRIARYSRYMLTQLLLKSKTLPALHLQAIRELDGLLDELNALLRSINGGVVLTADLTQHIRTAPDFAHLEPVLQRTVGVLLSNPGDSGKKLLQKISTILNQMMESHNQAVLELQAVTQNEGESREEPPLTEAQKQALQSWLRGKFPADTALAIGDIKAITGGGSKKTLIVQLRNTSQLPNTVVVRADSATGVVESTVSDEYQLIETLYAAGMPVPQPFASEIDSAIIGAPFVVVSCIEGRNIGDHVDVYEPSESFGLGIARALGKMHQIPPEQFGDKVPGAKITTREKIKLEIANFEAIWRNSGFPSVSLELAYAWLKGHMELTEGRRALNHGDVGCHNLLAKDGQLTALLDWETVFIGNPAYDLGYVYPEVIQMMSWEKFLAEYQKAGGTLPTQAELDFYRLWAAVCKVGYLFVARAYFHSGISNSLILAFATQHLHQRTEYQLQTVINDIYKRY